MSNTSISHTLIPNTIDSQPSSNSTVPSQGHGSPQPQPTTRPQSTSQPQPTTCSRHTDRPHPKSDRSYEIPTALRFKMADMVHDIPVLVDDVIQRLSQDIQLPLDPVLHMSLQHASNSVDEIQGHGGSGTHHIPQPLDFNAIQRRLIGYHEELTELFPTHSTQPLHDSSTSCHSLTTNPRYPSGNRMSYSIDNGLPLYIKIDMSQVALTTILYQDINGDDRVIHHTYIPFTAAERNLPARDREFLSIMSSLHMFREWIMGHSVTIITANSTTMTFRHPEHISTNFSSSNIYSHNQYTNIDRSEVQCYRCCESGNYAWLCPIRGFNCYLDNLAQHQHQVLLKRIHSHQTEYIPRSIPIDTSIVADNILQQPELNLSDRANEPRIHN